MKAEQEEIKKILAFYAKGHTQAETMKRFDISKNRLEYLAKRYKVSNGRTTSEIARTNGRDGSVKGRNTQLAKAKKDFEDRLKLLGFELISDYNGSRSPVSIKCVTCGNNKRITAHTVTTEGTTCSNCQRIKKKKLEEEQRAEKQRQNAERKKSKENEHKTKLIAPHVCKVCGKTYTVATYMKSIKTRYERNSGYCSMECRELRKKQRGKRFKIADNHRARARRYGCQYDPSITLKRLIAKKGLTCSICGRQCDLSDTRYSKYCGPDYPSIDHIIPMCKGGGHVWSNVQIAHIYCNCLKETTLGFTLT